jgi:hypothetical protein
MLYGIERMFVILLDAIFGALAGGLGVLLARRIAPPKTKPQFYRVLLVVFVVLGFQGAHQFIGPELIEWKRNRDFDHFLSTDPLFSTVLADNPALKAPLRAAVLKAYQSGKREEVAAAGRTLFASVFPQYLSRGSEGSVVKFTQSIVRSLRAMEDRDPERCYAYLHPGAGRSIVLTKDEGRDELLGTMRDVVQSAHANSTTLDEKSAKEFLQPVIAGLKGKYRDDLAVLQKAEDPGVNHAKVCEVTIALYSDVLALPPDEAGLVLKYLSAR